MRCCQIIVAISIFCNVLYAQNSTTKPAERKQLVNVRGEIFTTRQDPITLPLADDEDAFHFVIYGDRTGGEPSGLKFLKQAVNDTNLIDPDFVMTVGDLIQGYNRPAEWLPQMREFRGIMSGLDMNWFPVAGNHDVYWDFRDRNRPATHHEENYEKHFGPLWYSFEHKNCGFIVLYSDEGDPSTGEKGFREGRLQNVSDAQMEFLDQSLQRMKACKQIFVFLHHPRWLGGGYEGSNWPEVHQRFKNAGNVKGVFAGHIHHMTYEGPVDGIEYFTLATTGGHLSMDSPELGFLHHFNVVTVRDDQFTVAAIPVGAVIDPKRFEKELLADVEVVRETPKRAGDRLKIDTLGAAMGQYSVRIPNPGKRPIEVTIAPRVNGGWQVIPDHQHVVIPPDKSEGMTFTFYRPGSEDNGWSDFALPTMTMNIDYLHEDARIRLPETVFDLDIAITPSATNPKSVSNKVLSLRGVQSRNSRRRRSNTNNDSVRMASDDVNLPDGPFTIEAWINPTDISQSRGIVAKTQSSEYALFLHDGRPQFDVHLDGRYISPQGENEIALNSWSHIAGVFDGQEARLYVNGKIVQKLPASGQRTTNNLPLYVGADPGRNGNPTREFAGQIDEVRISKGVRYTAEFQPAELLKGDSSDVVLLHFDQSFGPFLTNEAGEAAPAYLNGNAELVDRNDR